MIQPFWKYIYQLQIVAVHPVYRLSLQLSPRKQTRHCILTIVSGDYRLDLDPVCEDPVGEEEGIEEVDGEEPEVGTVQYSTVQDGEEPEVSEPLQQPLGRGVADLGHLAVVQGPTEPGWCHS